MITTEERWTGGTSEESGLESTTRFVGRDVVIVSRYPVDQILELKHWFFQLAMMVCFHPVLYSAFSSSPAGSNNQPLNPRWLGTQPFLLFLLARPPMFNIKVHLSRLCLSFVIVNLLMTSMVGLNELI